MKRESVFKALSDLSFGQNTVTERSPSAPDSFQPSLPAESVQDFNVHPGGAAEAKPPKPERPPRRDDAPVKKPPRDSAQTAAREQGLRDAVDSGKEFRESLYRRYTAPFRLAIPYHRWGINE